MNLTIELSEIRRNAFKSLENDKSVNDFINEEVDKLIRHLKHLASNGFTRYEYCMDNFEEDFTLTEGKNICNSNIRLNYINMQIFYKLINIGIIPQKVYDGNRFTKLVITWI